MVSQTSTDPSPAEGDGLAAPRAATDRADRPGAPPRASSGARRPGRRLPVILVVALFLASAGLAARLLVSIEGGEDFAWYAGLLAVFFVLYSVVWVFPRIPIAVVHVILGVQCLVVLVLLLLEPEFDYLTALFVPLAYQAAVVLRGRDRWLWVIGILPLIVLPLTITLGLRGLGLALIPMAVTVAVAALAAASQDIEAARAQSARMVAELEANHRRLERYVAEVESLAAVEERNRLVRELHDSVSQAMFAVLLATRSADIMLEKDPRSVTTQLEQLRDLTQEALARMRGFIAELRQQSE
jgi:signal transduction histidine kinase